MTSRGVRFSTVMAVAAAAFASLTAEGVTYTTAKSGNWSESSTWNESGVPSYDGSELINIQNGHDVTFDGMEAEWYTLYVGSSAGTATSRYYQSGGTLASRYLTEINQKNSHTGPDIMELENVDALFDTYRLVIGRQGGNAQFRMKGGSLVFGAGNDGKMQLLMGITTPADAQPNVIDLENVAWTNKSNNGLQIGYTSACTNIVRLKNSSFVSEKAILLGYGNGNLGAVGQDFFIAENSTLDMPHGTVNMPNNGTHSAHLTLSNSTLKCSQLLLGNVGNTTNYLEIIDCPPVVSGSSSHLGYKSNTVNRVLFKDLKEPKWSGSAALSAFTMRSVAPGQVDSGTRWYDITFDNCDWVSTSSLIVSQQHNDRTFTFLNMSLPNVAVYAGYYADDAPGTLVLSNCTWTSSMNFLVASTYASEGVARVYDSTLRGLTLSICNDGDNHADQPMKGDLLLSGGTAAFYDGYVRRGTGKLTLERGARLQLDTGYFPNMTGAKATVVVDDHSELLVTNKLVIGNQAGTMSEITVRNGGRFVLCEGASSATFGCSCANFTLNLEGGELDLGKRMANFAVNADSVGIAYLRGGVLTAAGFGAPAETADQTVVFDGGTFRPFKTDTILCPATKAKVAAGGAVFDVAEGLTATISGSLAHDADLTAADGGLVKRGAGVLSLTGANAYTGPTVVEAGTLKVAADTLPSDSVVVAKGGVVTAANYADVPKTIAFAIESPDEDAKYVLASWTSAAGTPSAADFTVTGLPDGWAATVRGNALVARRLAGLMLILR